MGHRGYREIRTLQRRTTSEAISALEQLSRNAPDAARHLTSAWNHAFGRSPDPSRAYAEAIKAVEAAAIPVISPNNAKATLGTVIGDLKSAPQKCQLVLTRPSTTGIGSVEVVTHLVSLLWANQTDRHAQAQPIDQPQAEQAVHIALLLVHTFGRALK